MLKLNFILLLDNYLQLKTNMTDKRGQACILLLVSLNNNTPKWKSWKIFYYFDALYDAFKREKLTQICWDWKEKKTMKSLKKITKHPNLGGNDCQLQLRKILHKVQFYLFIWLYLVRDLSLTGSHQAQDMYWKHSYYNLFSENPFFYDKN